MNVKIASLAAVLACAVSGTALAADLTAKAPYAAPVSTFSWSGFYAGLHAGYGWGSHDWRSTVPGFPTSTFDPLQPKTKGVLGGVQAGVNYQVSNWVVGMEWDFAVSAHKATATGNVVIPAVVTAAMTATSSIDWLTQFTGRVGFAVDHTLFYAKGGVAAGQAKDGLELQAVGGVFNDFGTKSNLLLGWIGGAGIEHYFAPNMSAKIEYNYVDLGSTNATFFQTGVGAFQEKIDQKVQIVKVGTNYKF